MVRRISNVVKIPFTVGGGIRSIDDFKIILSEGANKVAVNSAAIKNPSLISKASKEFGSKCVVSAIDAKRRDDNSGWNIVSNGGQDTGIDLIYWARKVYELGAGEILLTSMDKDGTKDGYDLELTAMISDRVGIPVIASGGAGNLDHLYQAVTLGRADAVLCASIFHYREYTIAEAKQFLRDKGVAVRL